jgi:uncharacterized Zn-finger protein
LKCFLIVFCFYFLNVWHFQVHLKVKPLLCELCPAAFSTNQALQMHQLTHSAERRYLCQLCGKSFRTKQYRNIHTRLHTGERPYSCLLCGKTFSDPATFSKHRRTHELGTRKRKCRCTECGKEFTQLRSLKAHSSVHSSTQNIRGCGGGGGYHTFPNQFKLECLTRVREVGLASTATEKGVNLGTLRQDHILYTDN